MDPVKCPSCNTPLPTAEIAGGWCETCGKKIPAYVLEATRGTRPDTTAQRGAVASEAASQAPPAEVSFPDETRPKVPKGALVLGAIFVANAVLAWVFAGTEVWTVVMILAGFLLAMFVFGALKNLIFGGWRTASGEGLFRSLLLLLYAAALLGSGFWISEQFARGTVYVDNYSPHDVTLELDGSTWLKSSRQTTQVQDLGRGTYTLVVRAGDKELDRRSITVVGRGNYILNVLNAQVYARGEVQYGGFAFGPGAREQRIQEPWFSAKVDFLFEEPPKTITVRTRRGQTYTSASRTYLRRGEPKAPDEEP